MNDIASVDLLRLLPPSLKEDPKIVAFAQAVAEELQVTNALIRLNLIYARIDELDETLLDILAYDMHVDWYDYGYPLDVKRATIKDSVRVHRRLGTKYAVETALGNVFPGSRVEEWFQYGGDPYRFRVIIDATAAGVTAQKQESVLAKIRFYKNLCSHLDSISYQMETSGTVTVGAYHTAATSIEVFPYMPKDIEASGTAGIAAYSAKALNVEVYPFGAQILTGEAQAGLVAYTKKEIDVEVYPRVTRALEARATAGIAAIAAVAHNIEIFPAGMAGEAERIDLDYGGN